MNGYTTILINGETVGIKFGYLAIKAFSLAAEKKRAVYYDKVKDGDGKDVDQLSFLGIAKLIQCGYNNNCELKEVEPTLTLEDFNDWVEGSTGDPERQKQVTEALTVFAQSQYVKTLAEMPQVNGAETEDTKKKTANRGSKKLNQAY
jgi:hypothetical protein